MCVVHVPALVSGRCIDRRQARCALDGTGRCWALPLFFPLKSKRSCLICSAFAVPSLALPSCIVKSTVRLFLSCLLRSGMCSLEFPAPPACSLRHYRRCAFDRRRDRTLEAHGCLVAVLKRRSVLRLVESRVSRRRPYVHGVASPRGR